MSDRREVSLARVRRHTDVDKTWPALEQRGLCAAVTLVFAQTGCSVINPSGGVSPGGTTHSPATEKGFGGIWRGQSFFQTRQACGLQVQHNSFDPYSFKLLH